MANQFAALADPVRKKIVKRLGKRPMSVGELAATLPVTRPAVSQHLQVLRKAKLVRVTAQGTRRIYAIDPAGLGAIRAWLDKYWEKVLAQDAGLGEREEWP